MKNFLAKKDLADWFDLAAMVLAVVGVILYVNTGVTDFNEYLNVPCIVGTIVTAVILLVGFILPYKVFRYVAFALGLYAFIEYIASQVTYIANVFVSIDGSTFSAGLILTLASLLLVFALALASGILSKHDFSELFHKNEKKEAQE